MFLELRLGYEYPESHKFLVSSRLRFSRNFITAGLLDSTGDEVATVACTFGRDVPEGRKEDGNGNEMSNGRAPTGARARGYAVEGSRANWLAEGTTSAASDSCFTNG